MAKPRIIDTLPSNIRQELEKRITDSGFADYQKHTVWLNRQGIEIGVNTVRRYGKKLQMKQEQLKRESQRHGLSELEMQIIQAFRTSFDHKQQQVLQVLFGTPQLSLLLHYYNISSHSGRQQIIETAKHAERIEFF